MEIGLFGISDVFETETLCYIFYWVHARFIKERPVVKSDSVCELFYSNYFEFIW